MNYFSNLGQVWFTLPSGTTVIQNDITKFSNIVDIYRHNPRYNMTYTVKTNERPELIAYRLYDDINLWWTIILLNELWDFDNQWPLNDDQLSLYIHEKYPLNEKNDIHHYETVDGYVTDIKALSIESGVFEEDVPVTFNLVTVSISDYEGSINEKKRHIKLIDPDHMPALIKKIEAVYKEMNSQ